MSANISELVEKLGQLTLQEAAELTKTLREKWGIDAQISILRPAHELTQYQLIEKSVSFSKVVLVSVGDNKIAVIKLLRSYRNLGLLEAKNLVETPMAVLETDLLSAKAREIANSYICVGAVVQVVPIE